jgi:hypothetical protein
VQVQTINDGELVSIKMFVVVCCQPASQQSDRIAKLAPKEEGELTMNSYLTEVPKRSVKEEVLI